MSIAVDHCLSVGWLCWIGGRDDSFDVNHWLVLLQRSQTIRSISLGSNKMGSKAGRLLLEGVKVRSGGNCVC